MSLQVAHLLVLAAEAPINELLSAASVIYYLVAVAIVMTLIMSGALARSARVRLGIDGAIMLFFLLMMVAMFLGPVYVYLITLSITVNDVVIWEIAVFSGLGMAPIGGLIFIKFLMHGERLPLSGLLDHVSALRTSYIALLLLNELLMSWTFNLASGLISLSQSYGLGAVLGEVSYSFTTYWFVFTMATEMTLTILASRKSIRVDLLTLLAMQALVMLLTPTALASRSWEAYAFYLEVVVMTGVVVFAVVHLRGPKERDQRLLRYTGLFIIANAGMMAGFFWFLVSGDAAVLALSIVAQTAIYFDAYFTAGGLVAGMARAQPASGEGLPGAQGSDVPESVGAMGSSSLEGDPSSEAIIPAEILSIDLRFT